MADRRELLREVADIYRVTVGLVTHVDDNTRAKNCSRGNTSIVSAGASSTWEL